jgi:integrase
LSAVATAWLAAARRGSVRTRSGDQYKPSAIRSYDQSLRLRVLPRLGDEPVDQISRVDLQELIEELGAEGLAEPTIEATVIPLRAIYRRELASGRLKINPTAGLAIPRADRRRERIAPPAEAAALLAALPDHDQALWATAMYAGLRRGELRALRVDRIDFEAGVIHVERGWDDQEGEIATKGRKRRRVPIPGALRQRDRTMPPPTSAQRKFLRGVEQVGQLLADVDAFENRNAYVFRTEVESRSMREITFRALAVEREVPPEDWPLRAGEAIQNLRAALDHMVYAASGERDRTQFPIYTDADRFHENAPRMLQGVPESVVTTIEKAQPYQNHPSAPERAMLEQLRMLSNRDKHRTLATIASAVVREGVGMSRGVSVTWQQYGTNRPLAGGETHVSTFTASSEGKLAVGDVELFLDYEVRLEGEPFSNLKGIVHDVYRVLVECETGEPLSPLAPYPL